MAIRKLNEKEIAQYSKAIHVLCSKDWIPALRSAFAHLMPFIDDSVPTAYTDCNFRVGINPSFFTDITLEQLAVTILHETLHNVQNHQQRFEDIDAPAKLRNYVTDLEINSIIAKGVLGITLENGVDPKNGHWEHLIGEVTENNGKYEYEGVLLPCIGDFYDIPAGRTAEQYLGYFKCCEKPQNQNGNGNSQQDQNGNSQQQNGNSQQNGNGNQNDDQQGQSVVNKQGEEVGKNAIVDDCCCNSEAREKALEKAEELGINPISRVEREKVKDQLRHDIEECRSYGSGSMLDALDYIAKALEKPKVNWKRVLRTNVHNSLKKVKGTTDYSYSRVSRRYRHNGFIMPSTIAYEPKIRVAIDTSGSMGKDDFDKIVTEIDAILKRVNSKLEIVCVDTDKTNVVSVKSIKDIKLYGGGGTDMTVALDTVIDDESKNRPNILIVATDGYCDWGSFEQKLTKKELANTQVIVVLTHGEKTIKNAKTITVQ